MKHKEMKRETVFIIVAGVLAALLIAGLLYEGKPQTKTAAVKGPDQFRPTELNALPSVQGGTRAKLEGAVATPGLAGGTSTVPQLPGGVAIPLVIQPLGNGASQRTFAIQGNKNTFNPANIIVNEGDIVNIKFTAVDKTYDISFPDFGVYREVAKGDTATISFQAHPYGAYQFSCEKDCSGKPSGNLIVNQVQ